MCISFVIPDADIVAGRGEGRPRDVEPAGAGKQLVGEVVVAEEVDEALELSRIFRADVGGLADEVLRVAHTANQTVNATVAEA